MHEDMCVESLPNDLLLEIFRHLGSTAIIRCAGVCTTWRRVIIDNASCLRPRPDRCHPDLLLGFFDWYRRITPVRQLEDMETAATVGPSAETTEKNVLTLESAMDVVGPYDQLLTSRDGFVLIKVWHKQLTTSLCLCNILAGTSRSIPIPELGKCFGGCSYVLFTAYDDDSLLPDGVRILAAKGEGDHVEYQTFISSTSGGGDCWGPVKRSARLVEECDASVCVPTNPKETVVFGGGFIVYWLVMLLLFNGVDDEDGDMRTCLFGMDTRTDRTWTTQLPKDWSDSSEELAIAMSDDGQRVHLIVSESHELRHQIEVWVLDEDGCTDDDNSRWTLQRTMDMQSWLHPYWPWQSPGRRIWLRCICPRSGFLLAIAWGSGKQFLVGVDGSPSRLLGSVEDNESSFNLEYEMDWSTYISKMKYF